MRFRINVKHVDWGHRRLFDLVIEKGSLYLMSSSLTLKPGEYYLASRVKVPPSNQLPGKVSLSAGRHYFCSNPPRLSIKPDGQCHIRSASGSALWDLRSVNRIPITKHDGRHIFTVGVNNPAVFNIFAESKSKKDVHNINLEISDPASKWRNFRIVGFVQRPAEVESLKFNDGSGAKEISASDLIPEGIGISRPMPVFSKGPEGTDRGILIGVNPGPDWPEPFILHLIFRQWPDFKGEGGYQGGIIIMGAFDSEASNDDPMKMLTIAGPQAPKFRLVLKSRFLNMVDRISSAWREAVEKK